MLTRLIFFIVTYIVVTHNVFSQGKILLVGGGTENYESWSDIPYQWAVEQSDNKKVAIISYDAGSEPNWLPNYFESLGAVEATNFEIDSRNKANDETLINEINTFDVFFFKGGDQSQYYEYYKNTLFHTAVEEKYQQGGVIGGTSAGAAIMAGICYTAENGSVFPDEVIGNVFHPDITLKNDFFDLLTGIIVDTHFTERGRQARLMGFMANWYLQNQQMPIGVGVDDRTALCIAANGIATAYGSGSVAIYTASQLAQDDQNLIADSLHAVSLLHTHQYDLANMQLFNGSEQTVSTGDQMESGNYKIILHSEDLPSTELLDQIYSDKNLDSTVVISGSESGATTMVNALANYDLKHIKLVVAEDNYNMEDSAAVRNFIKTSHHVFFVNNNATSLFDFLNSGPTGQLIQTHIKRNNLTNILIGEDARFAGNTFATNIYADESIAYDGGLNYTAGLALLKNSIVMPDTYTRSTRFYENKVSAILYGMVKQPLRYGIYLNPESYLVFTQNNGKNTLQSHGKYPSIVAELYTGKAALNSNQRTSGEIRNIAGFSDMVYQIIIGDKEVVVGEPVANNDSDYEFEEVPLTTGLQFENEKSPILFFQRSQNNYLLQWPDKKFEWQIMTLKGQTILSSSANNHTTIDLNPFVSGLYILKVATESTTFSKKIVIP